VDYSGRSVIVVGPELKLYQCGLPKEMALELFKPFVMKHLVETGAANNIKSARKMVERAGTEVWDSLETVIRDHPVLLNRAPTLHRLGIQAFEPVLVEGRALKLHPLVCTAYNADFDGDQMAVHVPLSAEAQAEARFLMLAANNLLKPSDGRPVTVPTQDMVLGSYYLTMKREGDRGEGKVFRDEDEALMAYAEGEVSLHAPIKVRVSREIEGDIKTRIIDATVGRIIFNRPIPQDLGFCERKAEDDLFKLEIDFLVGKKQLGQIIDACIRVYGTTMTSEILDNIKAQGFKYSTRGAITVSVSDAVVPPQKKILIGEAEEKIDEINKKYRRGVMSDTERYKAVIEIWQDTTEQVADALKDNLDRYNPLFMMADSGARGTMSQIRQLAGMRGLIANTSGRTIEIPIRSNYREGLNILEYFISSRGARKGLADTALRTADSGYLTRRLVDVSQDVIIREFDCGSAEGIEVSDIKDGNEIIEPFAERLIGRYAVEDVRHPETDAVIVDNDTMITADTAKEIIDAGIKRVTIRSVLNCNCKHGVCAKCYGANLASGKAVGLGEAVGIISAQSIGEPGTQLTMRNFHTGGIAGDEDITQGLPRVEELFEARKPKPKNLAILTEISGRVTIDDSKKSRYAIVIGADAEGNPDERSYLIPYGVGLKVSDGDEVETGDMITEGLANPHDILAIKGKLAVQNYLIQEVQRVYRMQGVDINDKHIEVIVRQMMRKMRVVDSGDSELLSGALVDISELVGVREAVARRASDGEEARYPVVEPVLLGITKASLATDSFLSAASFQETTRVLTDAAIKGKTDPLIGLKENVIIGKLIPAGTGMERFNTADYEASDSFYQTLDLSDAM
jgi:DNA-directed RNA polymerase subunit beta'